LIVVLQGSVLRAAPLRRYRLSVYRTTAASMVIVSVLYLFRDSLHRLLDNLLGNLSGAFEQVVTALKQALNDAPFNPWIYLALHILLLAVIFGHAVPGWRRRALAPPPHAPIDLHSGQPVSLPADQQPVSVWDLVAGDLISRQIFTLVLALVLWF